MRRAPISPRWARRFAQRAKALVAIGEAADAIRASREAASSRRDARVDGAMRSSSARELARGGDVVLLSPGLRLVRYVPLGRRSRRTVSPPRSHALQAARRCVAPQARWNAAVEAARRRVCVRTSRQPPDTLLFAAVAALVAIGLVMVFSASSATAYAEHHDIAYYVKRQLVWLVVGLAGAYACYRIDYHQLQTRAPYLLARCDRRGSSGASFRTSALASTAARRWIGVSALSFQPSEFAKLALVIYLAAMLVDARRAHHVARPRVCFRCAFRS